MIGLVLEFILPSRRQKEMERLLMNDRDDGLGFVGTAIGERSIRGM